VAASPPTSAGGPGPEGHRVKLPWNERLARYIVEGSKEGLSTTWPLKLDESGAARHHQRAAHEGHEEVGRLFNDNQLIVAEVLQSAWAMKASVGLPGGCSWPRTKNASRGTIVLATVKGDVPRHRQDLVEIILRHGYRTY